MELDNFKGLIGLFTHCWNDCLEHQRLLALAGSLLLEI